MLGAGDVLLTLGSEMARLYAQRIAQLDLASQLLGVVAAPLRRLWGVPVSDGCAYAVGLLRSLLLWPNELAELSVMAD